MTDISFYLFLFFWFLGVAISVIPYLHFYGKYLDLLEKDHNEFWKEIGSPKMEFPTDGGHDKATGSFFYFKYKKLQDVRLNRIAIAVWLTTFLVMAMALVPMIFGMMLFPSK
ncbi:MAG TPA: hypothetical protein DEA55_03930 [Rhodospirillaceae bacterium]|nr:hypothetical protein [Rhodospirillaceae bacterium]